MNTPLWCFIFVILVLLIIAFSIYLCHTLIGDYCCQTTPRKSTLSRHNDIEDLTNITRTPNTNIYFVNEAEKAQICELKPSLSPSTTPRASLRRKYSLLPDIHESSDLIGSSYSISCIMSELQEEKDNVGRGSEVAPRRFSVVTEGMRKNSLAAIPFNLNLKGPTFETESSDTLDHLDPTHIEVLRAIDGIEEQARTIDFDIVYFMGGHDLKYYEINEKLIKCKMALSEIGSFNEEQRKRKTEVRKFIAECQDRLKRKV